MFPATREEFAALLLRVFGAPTDTATLQFQSEVAGIWAEVLEIKTLDDRFTDICNHLHRLCLKCIMRASDGSLEMSMRYAAENSCKALFDSIGGGVEGSREEWLAALLGVVAIYRAAHMHNP